MKTLIISAFPACGKTYAHEHNKHIYRTLDSDSSKFSWLYDENDNKTDVRNPEFPNNYISYIKNNIGKVDIIFVSSHLLIRQAMTDAGINFVTVYPQKSLLNEWVGRMYRRGNDDKFINFIINNWTEMMHDIIFEPHGGGICRLGNNEYIDIEHLYQWGVGFND